MLKFEKYFYLPEIVRIREDILNNYSNKLIFKEATHEYFLDGEKLECVSNITHVYSPFDREAVLESTYQRALRDELSAYHGMTKQEISDRWDSISGEACEKGTNVHSFGEGMFYYLIGENENIPDDVKDCFDENGPHPRSAKEEAVMKFWFELPENFVPVLAETKVFNLRGTKYSGTFDLLLYYVDEKDSSKSGLVLCDYKTNKDLYKNFKNQKMLAPFDDYLDQPIGYYRLQFSCYQIPLEYLKHKVIARRLIWLKEDGNYDKIKIENISDRMKNALKITD